jgi:hypothetical protein
VARGPRSRNVCRRRPGAPHATRASWGRDGDIRALECPGRSGRTLPSYIQDVFKLVFGSSGQALATARRLHRRHAGVRGSLPERLGIYAEGTPYFANEVSAL